MSKYSNRPAASPTDQVTQKCCDENFKLTRNSGLLGKLTLLNSSIYLWLILLGVMIGYFITLYVKKKKISALEQEVEKLKKELSNRGNQEYDQNKAFGTPSRALSSELDAEIRPYVWQEQLVTSLSEAIQVIENSVLKVKDPGVNSIAGSVNKGLNGLSVEYPGLKAAVEKIKIAEADRRLDHATVLLALNDMYVRKGLARLYGLSQYPKLDDKIRSYYRERNIDVASLEKGVSAIFDGLKIHAGVEFELPVFGKPFDDEKYALISNNYGPIYDVDNFSLSSLLKSSFAPTSKKPIIDVGEIAIAKMPGTNITSLNFPDKTSVGYYEK